MTRPASELTIVMYHYVRDLERSAHPRIKALDVAKFRRQLDHLQAHYRPVGHDDIVRCCREGVPLPERACWLTFDDGYADHFDVVLPELLRRGMPGAFFPPGRAVEGEWLLQVNRIHYILASVDSVEKLIGEIRALLEQARRNDAELPTFEAYWQALARPGRYDGEEVIFVKRLLQHALPEPLQVAFSDELFRRHVSDDVAGFARQLYMSREQLQELVRQGMYVGSHGQGHIWLDKASAQEQAQEIDRSLSFLASLGAPTRDWVMCYPYGGYNEATLALLRERDCLVGLTTRPGVAMLGPGPQLELPRLDTNDLPQ